MSSTVNWGPEWQRVPENGSIPSYTVYTGALERPDLDLRDYRLFRLDNGLHGILVHDSTADKAAACVSIAVGALNDPDDVPGLAHFCEHMLSKGSEPYPAENDFLSFISSNGGTRNASTGGSHQDYWFSIKPTLLSQALPRLAAFFHSPLFTPTLTAREIHAVDSENKRNLQNDSRRLFQLGKSVSLPGHPWTKFSTGNFATLTEAARKEVEKGGHVPSEEEEREESLDELTEMVVPLFSRIANRGLDPRPCLQQPAWGPDQMGTIIFAKTVKDFHGFSLGFQIPTQLHNYETRPTYFLSHWIGHEGPGSICTYLKKKGWLVEISAGLTGGRREVQYMRVSGELTREGYLHYEEVILTILDYIKLLRSSVLEVYHYEDSSTMANVSFRFREKSQPHAYVTWLCDQLLEPYPPSSTLNGVSLLRRWDEQLVRDMLALLTPENGRVMIMAKHHDARIVGENAVWEAEKWYGTAHFVRKLTDEFLEKANRPNENAELHLPRPNPYIPQDLSLDRAEVPEPIKLPSSVRDTDLSTLWFKKDDQYWVPRAHVKVDIRSPLAYTTPRHAVLTRLLTDLLEDDLAEITYDASLAGLHYSVNNHRGGIVVAVSGYNDKLGVLLDTVVDRLKTLVVKADRLEVMKEQLKRELENFYLRQPSVLAEHYMSCAVTPIVWAPEDKLHELTFVDVEDINNHKEELLSRVYIESLITGNIKEERALTILDSVEQRLDPHTLLRTERPRSRSLLLPPGANFVLEKTVADSKELNSSLLYYCQFGDIADTRLRCILRLLVHSIREPAFSQLRTVEQLGYIVSVSFWGATGSMGMGIKIQSLKSPSFLEERVDAFLKQFRDSLAVMTPEDFQSQKDGLIMKLLEREKNLREETSRFWNHIKSGYYDFLEHETDSVTVNDLTLQEVLVAFDRYALPSSRTRKKMSVHLKSQQLKTSQDVSAAATLIHDEYLFKAGLVCSTAAIPVNRRVVGVPPIVAGTSRL
ncbi:hypothetical protein EIP91_006039 [Steccherinum ochraceum]|uniref:Insulinase (Peptidase M16) n=1 Tax=Steccherinum ochraceum TaxID=92696 RepID=A0A4R0R6K7_9APHY|nr:hypothetical protein EIP91_006039 [Steccherinum ochraceum]